MKLYRLWCMNEDGDEETNGYFVVKLNAQIAKQALDSQKGNKKYGIIQFVEELETED